MAKDIGIPGLFEAVRAFFREKGQPSAPQDDFERIADDFHRLTEHGIPHFGQGRGPKVLLATSMGTYSHGVVTDGILGVALKARGAEVDLLLCDQFLPGCQSMKFGQTPLEVFAASKQSPKCPKCYLRGSRVYQAVGLPVLKLSDFVTMPESMKAAQTAGSLPGDKLRSFAPDGIPVGEHAYAGALRYFARGDLVAEPQGETVVRSYLQAAMLSTAAMKNLIAKNHYDIIVAHHGIYVPQGLFVATARALGRRVVTWNPAYRKHCFIFSHDDSYHHTMVGEPVANWRDLPWDNRLEGDLGKYLRSRWDGTEDWIWFHNEPEHDTRKIANIVGLKADKPTVTLLSNVVWDAQLHYASNAFPGMIEWVLETIRYFSSRPDLQLVIRIHPAEVRGFVPSRQPLEAEIRRAFSMLPSNVYVVPPESDVSTYALCESSNAVLIYNTKTGMEVTAQGVPTIVAGEAWIRGKGFCDSPSSKEEYFKALEALPVKERMSAGSRELARKYAYHVFFRRMIPLPFIEPQGKSSFSLELQSADALAPGRFLGLDVICDGIIKGTPFIYPAESLN